MTSDNTPIKSEKNPWDQPSKRVSDFLSQAQASPQAKRSGKARIIFALDATASRAPTWDAAMKTQSEMFLSTKDLGSLSVQLMFYRSYDECKASRWVTDPRELLALMTSVKCMAGHTQISRILQRAIKESETDHVAALIFIGDAFEEKEERNYELATELCALQTPIYIFQEGNLKRATEAFKRIAYLSGGARLEFNSNSPEALKHLLQAVATYAVGGLEALQNLSTNEAKELLRLTHQSGA